MDFQNLLLPEFPNCLGNILFFLMILISSHLYGVVPSSATESNRCNFPAIFNFGDSNSDTGGLAVTFGQPPTPYGETFFGRPSGRYSDGRLIIDFMAQSLGLPYLSAYLDGVGSNFSHGANFATCASTIRPQNSTIPTGAFSPITLNVQFTEYSEFLTRSQFVREGIFEKLLPTKDIFAQALYTIDIGQNDFTAAYRFDNMTTETVTAIVPDLLDHISEVVKDIYGKGGRSFWIHNTGPVGCLPYTILLYPNASSSFDKYGCAIPYNDVAKYFNQALQVTVAELRKALLGAAITYVDIYSVKYKILTRASELGFEKPFEACCGYGGGKYNYDPTLICGATRVVDGKPETAEACEFPSRRVVWDGIHFTEAANSWIFNQIVNGSFSDPPVSLNRACQTMHP